MTHFQDPADAPRDKVAQVIATGAIPTVQFGVAAQAQDLGSINELCREFGAQVQIRFFGWEWKEFDTSILEQLPDVQNLSIDTLRTISDFAPIAALPKLTRFRFEVYEHPNGEFLNQLELQRFTHISLVANKRRNFDLSPLARATSLEHLFVQGHGRGIEAISGLPKLSNVFLSGFPKRHDLAFLNDLPALRSLMLMLGSRESISELANAELRTLKIVWVRLLEDVGHLARFKKLEELVIEDQLRLTEIDISGLRLRRLRIANCKNLTCVSPVE